MGEAVKIKMYKVMVKPVVVYRSETLAACRRLFFDQVYTVVSILFRIFYEMKTANIFHCLHISKTHF